MTSASTPTSLTEARDRVAGVVMGVIVMWLVYDGISPSWTIDTLRDLLAKIMGAVADVADLQASQEPTQSEAAQAGRSALRVRQGHGCSAPKDRRPRLRPDSS